MRGILRWLLLPLLVAHGVCWAQHYPRQAVKLLVPFGPGSGSDIVARRLASFLQERWKQPVIVENRPGAQGVIGSELLKNALPDGYTLGVSTNSTHAAAQHLYKKLPYDPINDFTHLTLIGVGGSVALVPRHSPFRSIAELVTHAKTHPGTVFFGHADTSSQIPGALLKSMAGLPMEGVPYKASAQIVTDLIGGQIQVAFFNYMTGAAQVANGRLMPIAITESKPNLRWPGVPPVSDTVAGYEVTFFVGISAPRGLSPNIAGVIQNSIREAQAHASVKEPLEAVGLTFVANTDYRSFIVKESLRWREQVRSAGLSPP